MAFAMKGEMKVINETVPPLDRPIAAWR